MAELLRLFVSASSDLEDARALIGRAVAELPVQIGIEIRRTPAAGGKYDDIYELIANCDRVYFLLGRDISAPAGAEWHLAWQLERSVLPLRRYRRLTPAATEYTRFIPVEWHYFRTATQLNRIITADLVRILKHPTTRYGLTLSEMELLSAHGERIRHTTVDSVEELGGAEGGGILLDAGRRPSEGVLLGEED